MEIKIFGVGCSKCKQLEVNVKKALEETGTKVELKKITEINKIILAGIMTTPALAVDGKVVCSGRIPTAEEIKKLL